MIDEETKRRIEKMRIKQALGETDETFSARANDYYERWVRQNTYFDEDETKIYRKGYKYCKVK